MTERGTGLNVLPIPQGYSLAEQYAQYARFAAEAPHIRITSKDRNFTLDAFPQHCINLIEEAIYIGENARINPFGLKGIQDATAMIAGIYLAERQIWNPTHVDFPQEAQQAVDQNKMRAACSRDISERVAKAAQSPSRLDLRRLIIVDFLREIGERQTQMIQGKFGGWEQAANDYRFGVALVMRRWQSISSEA